MRLAPLGPRFWAVVVAMGVSVGLASTAEAQHMDLNFSRLRVGSVGGMGQRCGADGCAPGLTCGAMGICVPDADPGTVYDPDALISCPSDAGGRQYGYCADHDAFRRIASQFGAAMIPPVLMPAHTNGQRGIHISIETSITGIDNSDGTGDYWHRGTEGNNEDDSRLGRNRFVDPVLAWNRIAVRKGLPYGFELGTTAGFLLNTSYWAMGLEVRWAIFEGLRPEGSPAHLPSLSVRGAVQTLIGEAELTMTVPSVDLVLGGRFVIGDAVELSPFVAGQVAWIFADTEIVDLTPGTDAFNGCDPYTGRPRDPTDPRMPPDPNRPDVPQPVQQPTPGPDGMLGTPDDGVETIYPAPLEPPYCRTNGTDLNHNVVFERVRAMRSRLHIGLQARYEWFALTAAFAIDLTPPSALDDSQPDDLPHQWQVNAGLGVSY